MLSERNATSVVDLVEKIAPILSGHDPDVQGAVLGDLFARHIAGHAGELEGMREDLITLWMQMVRDLVAVYDIEPKSAQKKIQKKIRKKREKNEAKSWTRNPIN